MWEVLVDYYNMDPDNYNKNALIKLSKKTPLGYFIKSYQGGTFMLSSDISILYLISQAWSAYHDLYDVSNLLLLFIIHD